MNLSTQNPTGKVVEIPRSTGWPLAAAFGFALLSAGLITHVMISILGIFSLCAGLIGWFREVLPREAHESVPLEKEELAPARPITQVRHLQVGEAGHRARLPLQIYPYRAGIWGGLVGGVAMAGLAVLYGVVRHQSIWYPVNLLAAAGSATISAMSYDQLRAFNAFGLLLAVIVHAIVSVLIGLLYGVALPIFPRRPILLGGILVPIFLTGSLYAGLGVINPALQARIDWPWFMVCQFAFGLVAGWVVARQERISTLQHLPFVMRAGVEGQGIGEDEGGGKKS